MRLRSFASFLCLSASLGVAACGQTPTVVPVKTMEQPKDVDYICLKQTDLITWKGVPLSQCAVDATGAAIPPDIAADAGGEDADSIHATDPVGTGYHLHAVVTQESRGELAVADLGQYPADTNGGVLIKTDPRVPGYSFLPVGRIPTDVVADPNGAAVYVSSGVDERIDIIPAEMLRGPVDTDLAASGEPMFPHVDLDPNVDGPPNRMVIYSDPDGHERLFVTLPDSPAGPRIAVYDLTTSPLTPNRQDDIVLSATAAPIPQVDPQTSLSCGAAGGSLPWWDLYETKCNFPLETARIVTPTDPPGPAPHLAGIVVAGGYLFAADDQMPLVHVFDLHAMTEIRSVNVGSSLTDLSVSPPVPDEVTPANAAAIDECEALGWLGDGQTHPGTYVDSELGGRCNLHRYIYGVDIVNSKAGNGSIAVIDIPVLFNPDPKGPVLGPNGKPADETIDTTQMEMLAPLACDSPTFVATRVPMSSFGTGGSLEVPARAVAFVRADPLSNSTPPLQGVRCRAGAANQFGNLGKTLNPDGTLGVTSASEAGADNDTEVGLLLGDPALNLARESAATSWSGTNVSPQRLRGVFAMVALQNGQMVVVDIDDYDATCRGVESFSELPEASSTPVATEGVYPIGRAPSIYLGQNATDEQADRPVRRHHPRSVRLLNSDDQVATLAQPPYVAPLTGTASSGGDITAPTFIDLGTTQVTTPGDPNATATPMLTYLLFNSETPYALQSETWSAVYEGPIPGTAGSTGALEPRVQVDGSGNPVINPTTGLAIPAVPTKLTDPNAQYCDHGVLGMADGTDANNNPTAYANFHDYIQITDQVCHDDYHCADANQADTCNRYFGDVLDTTVEPFFTRDFDIQSVDSSGQLTITPARPLTDPPTKSCDPTASDAATVALCTELATMLQTCFPGIVGYQVRGRGQWVISGSATGFLHRRMTASNGTCTDDPTAPAVFNGRYIEQPVNVDPTKLTTCDAFVNPFFTWIIHAGQVGSERGGSLSFPIVRSPFQPLFFTVGTAPTAARFVGDFSGYVDQLGWAMISTVDAVGQGLYVFDVFDQANAKIIN